MIRFAPMLPPTQFHRVNYSDWMTLSEEQIDEFIEIYRREFGEPISREDAMSMARRLVNLYRLFLVPPRMAEEQDDLSRPTAL